MTKIDIFPHLLPKAYFDKMLSMSDRTAYMQKRVRDIPVMYDLDTRFRIMEQYDGYTQVLTLNLPPIEIVAGPKESPDLAKLANIRIVQGKRRDKGGKVMRVVDHQLGHTGR